MYTEVYHRTKCCDMLLIVGREGSFGHSYQRVVCTELGPEDVSLLEVSSFQRVVCTGFNGVGTCPY